VADIDELHAKSVQGDIDMVKGAVKRGGLAAQKVMAKMLRGKSHKEPDLKEPDMDSDDTKFSKTGSATASVGGGT
jgi:hypothetical protein